MVTKSERERDRGTDRQRDVQIIAMKVSKEASQRTLTMKTHCENGRHTLMN